MSAEEIVSKHNEACAHSVSAFKRDLGKVRTGRASSGILEGIMVDYYGSKVPVSQLAQITTPEARLIVLQVYDASAVASIEKAIHGSGLGFNPARDGNTIRISIPPLTEESRKELVKHLHKMAEEIKVSIRNHRRDANDKLKKLEKDAALSKDDAKRVQDRIQKQTDAHIAQVDTLLAAKEAESMEV